MTKKKNIYTFTGDGSFAYTHDHVIKPFLEKTAGDLAGFPESDWSLANRIRTDGAVIMQGVKAALSEKAASVKYPGASATAEEREFVCTRINCPEPQTDLGKGKSPNAPVRGIAGFDASIIRTPTASASLVKPLETRWTAKTPVEILTLEKGGRAANAQICRPASAVTLEVNFTDHHGTATTLLGANGSAFHLEPGSTLSLTRVDMDEAEKLIRSTLERALKEGADVTFTNKNTVLTSIDAPIKKRAQEIYQQEFEERFTQAGLSFHSGLVDDAFAYLVATQSSPAKPHLMLCPDDLYGAQIKHVLEEVKRKGLHYRHTENAIAIGRLSNGYGDEYGGIHFTPKAAGTLAVRDAEGKALCSLEVQPGQLCLAAGSSAGAARDYARRMIDFALNNKISGKDVGYLYFGFDAKSPAEGPLVPILQQVIDQHRAALAAKGVIAEIREPAQVSADLLTNPPQKGVVLALNNLWGDIIADLFPALANNRASYDSLLLSDRGFLAETGSGGTAPDLLFGRVKDGKNNGKGLINTGHLLLNPVAILSSYAEAMRYTGQQSGNAAQITYADHLHEAIILTMKQGFLTGDLMKGSEHQLRDEMVNSGAQPRPVDTRVFVKATEANLFELQGKTQASKTARDELQEMIVKYDLATVKALEGSELEAVMVYATSNPGEPANKKATRAA